MTGRKILTLGDLSAEEVSSIVQRSSELKAMHRAGQVYTPLVGQTFGLGLRELRPEMAVPCCGAIGQMGGVVIPVSVDAVLDPTMSVMLDKTTEAVVLGACEHDVLRTASAKLSVAMVNAGSDRIDPIAFLADCQAWCEQKTSLKGRTVAWLGGASARCHAYIQGAVRCGFTLKLACAGGVAPNDAILAPAAASVSRIESMEDAIEGSDLVAFDTVTGDDGNPVSSTEIERLLALVDRNAITLPGPNLRGLEPARFASWSRSVENRLHIWKSILELILQL